MLDLTHKKILVVGANGFIGSHVIRTLLKHGVPEKNIFAPSSKECDVRKAEDCRRAVKGQEVVFDCVANAGDLLTRAKIPGDIFNENLIMGLELLRAAWQEGVEKIITIGSVTEYPESATSPLREETLWNGLPVQTSIPYGLSKRIVGLQGELYRRQTGFNSIHIILTNSYGPGEKFSSGYMIPSLIQKVMNAKKEGKKEIEAWGTGKATRDILYVEDSAEGIVRAAESYNEALPLNIASGTEISIRDMLTLLCSYVGYEGTIVWDPTKPEGELRRFLDISRARNLIGFTPVTTPEEGLKKTLAWHSEHSH